MATVTPSTTPNPNAMKFTLDAPLAEVVNVTRPEDATGPPFVTALFALDGVVGVFGTADFVTVSKAADADWAELTPAVTEVLAAHL
ncbi:MAG: Scaffold protein Nfu/NifU [Acidimicrobiales bacterium]|nr:Scaffold protein Nfu/NifU [Acidimicrobiales bacterium]